MTKICSLCLNSIDSASCNALDDICIEILEVLFINGNYKAIIDPVSCEECLDSLYKAFNFKSTCILTEDILAPYMDTQDVLKLDLKEIYLKENGDVKHSDNEDMKICRLCMSILANNSFDSLTDALTDKDLGAIINNHLPEMHINTIKGLLACNSCLDSLYHFAKFTKSCLDTSDKIMKYCQIAKVEDSFDLHNVVKHMDLKQENILEETNSKVVCRPNKQSLETSAACIKRELDERSVLDGVLLQSLPKCREEKPQIYECTYCNFVTTLKGVLHRHLRNHNKLPKIEEIVDCKSSENIDILLSTDQKSHEMKMFKCPECPYQIKCKATLKSHLIQHSPEWHKCQICTFKTKYKHYLKPHMITHKDHTEVKLYKCKKCKFKSKYFESVKKHMNVMHQNPDKAIFYKCKQCEFQTIHKCYLTTHYNLMHPDPEEVKKFECPKCSLVCRRKKNLAQHILKMHNDKMEIHKCPKCSFQSKYSDSMKKHLLKHEDSYEPLKYICDQCQFESKNKSGLIRHVGTHQMTDETKMFKCKQCDFRGKYQYCVSVHVRHKHQTPVKQKIYKHCSAISGADLIDNNSNLAHL